MAEATEEAATAVAAFVAYEARALEELARCASAISPSLHSLLPEIAERFSTQLGAARANGAFWSQMLEDMDLLDAPSEEACASPSDAPPPGGEAAEAAQADVHGVLLQLRCGRTLHLLHLFTTSSSFAMSTSSAPSLTSSVHVRPTPPLRREWSEEGAVERQQSFDPILEALARFVPFDAYLGPPVRVLVPGAGLGRLVYEAAMRGYEALGTP